MQYHSTRENTPPCPFSDALRAGLAADGGLYVPDSFPQIDLDTLREAHYVETATQLLTPYFTDDILLPDLSAICSQAFNFPVPLNKINDNTYLLELFHGPTLAFKDFGARFLAECLNRLSTDTKTTLMIATSGDTGSAVAAAFHGKENIQVVILYPEGKISDRQAHQITCWGDNILALAIDGTFDDCQHLVKSTFTDANWQDYTRLSTANSINIGRLLPQMTYYAFSSLQFLNSQGEKPGFIVPSGNFGNVTAAFWAKAMGFPIRDIAVATNANTVVPDYLATGHYAPRASVETLANAMDVGKPSNFERLQYLFPALDTMRAHMPATAVSDHDITATIKHWYQTYNKIICPHTATACFAREQLSDQPWVAVATADASKFANVIEPMIGAPVPVPSQLAALLAKPTHLTSVKNDASAVLATVKAYFG